MITLNCPSLANLKHILVGRKTSLTQGSTTNRTAISALPLSPLSTPQTQPQTLVSVVGKQLPGCLRMRELEARPKAKPSEPLQVHLKG